MLQLTKIFLKILSLELCGNSYGKPPSFQDDCAPVHKARFIKTWLDEFGVEEFDWSRQSPDLKPIEHHLWVELEKRLKARSSLPTSELINAILDEWAKIPTHIPKML